MLEKLTTAGKTATTAQTIFFIGIHRVFILIISFKLFNIMDRRILEILRIIFKTTTFS